MKPAVEPEVAFIRQFITVACLDYIALSFPHICQLYLNRWRRSAYGDGGDFEEWRLREKRGLCEWLTGEGMGLAQMVDMDAYIERARRATAAQALAIEHGQYQTRGHRKIN